MDPFIASFLPQETGVAWGVVRRFPALVPFVFLAVDSLSLPTIPDHLIKRCQISSGMASGRVSVTGRPIPAGQEGRTTRRDRLEQRADLFAASRKNWRISFLDSGCRRMGSG